MQISHQRRTALLWITSFSLVVGLSGCSLFQNQAHIEALKKVRFIDTAYGVRAILDEAILFETDSADLNTQSSVVLDALTPYFEKAHNDIVIEGHTDSRGRAEYNNKLSLQRALAVKSAMVARKIPEKRIITDGLGSSVPVVPNAKTPQELAKNRRAEFVFLGETVKSMDLK